MREENKLEGKEKNEERYDGKVEKRRTGREEKRGEITRRESSTTISRYRRTKAQKIELWDKNSKTGSTKKTIGGRRAK